MKRTTRQAWGLALWSALAGVALTGCGTAADESALSNELIQANDDAFTTSRNQAGTSPYVLANDTTSQRSAVGLRITSFSQGARGSVNYNHDGTFTYTADQNKDAGQDSFTYTATDERGVSKSATVRVTTTAAWDAAGYRLPGANAFSPFAASNVQTFTFANGGALLLWSQSAIAPAVGTLQTVWMREYRPDTGWSNNKPIISGILNWKAHHSSAANSLFLVAMQPKPGIADPSKITGALYAYRYDALQGWVKASNNANAEIASTLISGTDGNAPIALPLETNYVVNARASVNADSNGNSSEDGSAVVVWQQGSPTSTLRSNSYKNLST
ncbi:MAG: cadherin-like domain-containing protein, partial [Gammaproteobacteria bacterium]|nr:cadherin-like domain-containing protein [Gammaproteobacteria bacterium]